MAFRGRLINKFIAVINRIDAAAIEAADDFDDDFRVIKPGGRAEVTAVRVPCQLDRAAWGRNEQTPAGIEIIADIILTLHWPDLERLGLIDTSGRAKIAIGDRVAAIETLTGSVEETFPSPPGMFVVHTERGGHGLAAFGSPRTNLLICYCAFATKALGRSL